MFELFVYECFRFYRRGFLGGEPPRASVLAQICFVPFLSHRISRLTPLNDNVLVLFYNVISTGVRTTVRTQRRNPPRKGFFVRVRK